MRYTKKSWKVIFKYWFCLSKMGLIHRKDGVLTDVMYRGLDNSFEHIWENYIPGEKKVLNGDIDGQ